MALSIKKQITITGESTIDGAIAEKYTASINTNSPNNMTLTTVQVKKQLAKENRETCRADRAEFEDMAYSIQDEMITEAEDAETEEETKTTEKAEG